MRRTVARWEGWLFVALTMCVCLAGAWAISLAIPLPSPKEFNFGHWEMRHLPDKWVYLAGRRLRGGLSGEEEDERLGRYLVLSARIRTMERSLGGTDAPSQDLLGRLRHERDGLENDVEAIIEGRLTSVLEETGLESSLPLFPDARWVFPPVDVEFNAPPLVLNVSRRDRIELVEQRPLEPGLSLQDVEVLEQTAERDGERSALVESISGVATYPSIVASRGDYELLVETVAHEWVHHYLFFKPLGRRALANLELQTLNETVADLAGLELAALLVERYPLAPDAASQLEALSPPEPAVDVDAVLRRLRIDVEMLLAAGKVEDAETLMAQRRQELADAGVVFRKINQAFFAFRSVYAGNPASIDPVGGKIETLRERMGSVGAFLRAASRLTSEAELDALLAGLSRPSS